MNRCRVYQGWHASASGRLGETSPDKATEGVGRYVFTNREETESFTQFRVADIVDVKVNLCNFAIPDLADPAPRGYAAKDSVTLRNPIDVREEPLYFLFDEGDVMLPPDPGDSDWLKAHKEAIRHCGTTDKNWGKTEVCRNTELTRSLCGMGYDGAIFYDWVVSYPCRRLRGGS